MPPLAPFAFAALLATRAANAPAPAPMQAPAAVASPAPAVGGDVAGSYNAGDLDTLRPLVGKIVEVTGTPTATGKSKSGTVMYLNFAGAHKAVALVFFTGGGSAAGADPGAKKATSEDDLKPFVGKPVSVRGKLADYKGDLQIVVDSLDQIKVTP